MLIWARPKWLSMLISCFISRTLTVDMTLPQLKVSGNYDMSGNVFVLPINGQGTFTLNMTGVTANLLWKITKTIIDGKQVNT